MAKQMYRYKATVEYFGPMYCGMQRQPQLIGKKTVQGELEMALSKFYSTPITIDYCGRTDSGVHAYGQVIHFDAPDERPASSIIMGTQLYLGEKNRISITDAVRVDSDFHSRYSAKKRFYVYKILNRLARPTIEKDTHYHMKYAMNVEAMAQAAKCLVGTHDFTSFRSADCQSKTPIRHIDEIKIVSSPLKAIGATHASEANISKNWGDAECNTNYECGFEPKEILIYVSGVSFLHHMVRNIVGTLIETGKDEPFNKPISWVEDILKMKDRTKAGVMVPAHGLYLVKAEY